MEQQRGVSHVVHRRVGRFRQYLAIPVHGLRERRWRLSHTLRDFAFSGGKAILLSRDDHRTVFRQFIRQSLEHVARFHWSRMGAVLLDCRVSDLLQLTDGIDILLSDCFFFRRVTLGYLSKGMG